jgi:hypothetical protein
MSTVAALAAPASEQWVLCGGDPQAHGGRPAKLLLGARVHAGRERREAGRNFERPGNYAVGLDDPVERAEAQALAASINSLPSARTRAACGASSAANTPSAACG